MTQNCQNIKIREWRATPEQPFTAPNRHAELVLDAVCNKVVQNFPAFITQKGLKLTNYYYPTGFISIIPADLDHHGEDYRNLNDIGSRFAGRTVNYDENNNPIPIWGYFQRSTLFVYVRNDVLTPYNSPNLRFITVFAHELYHLLAWEFEIYQQYSGSPDIVDEKMAQDFTAWMGWGR